MTAPRTPEQRARFVRSAASDLDIAPELAERLLLLSEAARSHARAGGRTDARTVRALLDCLLDDDVCRHAWRVAAVEDDWLWRSLRKVARPPRDVGPAVLLAVALACGGAAGQALEVITDVVRTGEFRRSAIELAADLAEDAGRPDLAWSQVVRLGLADQDEGWSALRCVVGCSGRGQCARSRLAGVTHARWLRQRIARWARRPWSGSAGEVPEPDAGYLAARRSILPLGERQLLERWAQVRPGAVTVLNTGRWEAVVSVRDGVRRVAGWESRPPPTAVAGSELTCWLLPTLVPDEHLLVRSTLPPPW